MEEIRMRARAKINLTLDVTGKREDGYHLLRMVMQNVALYDDITIRRRQEAGIVLTSNLPWLPCDERNLAWRAACLMQEEFGLSDEQTRLIGTQEDYDEVAVRFVTDPAGRRMWEFSVELNLDGTACSIGIYVNAANGEIVLLDYVTGGNG